MLPAQREWHEPQRRGRGGKKKYQKDNLSNTVAPICQDRNTRFNPFAALIWIWFEIQSRQSSNTNSYLVYIGPEIQLYLSSNWFHHCKTQCCMFHSSSQNRTSQSFIHYNILHKLFITFLSRPTACNIMALMLGLNNTWLLWDFCQR